MTSPGRGPRRTPEEARLIERFKRLAPQQKALLLALAPFSDDNGQFDRDQWEKAFNSREPEQIVAVTAVTGLYEGLVNHLVEMLHAAARLRGLDVATGEERPNGPGLFTAVGDDGGLTANQVDVLKRLYAMRNELQHASPGVEADEVYDDVVLLTKTLARFAKSYVEWLKQHGVSPV
jgi:hypothetical protein